MEQAILELLAGTAAGKSVSPEQVARLVDPEGWRRRLPEVRRTAIALARQGRLEIIRHGKRADPDTLKGVYRIRSPVQAAG